MRFNNYFNLLLIFLSVILQSSYDLNGQTIKELDIRLKNLNSDVQKIKKTNEAELAKIKALENQIIQLRRTADSISFSLNKLVKDCNYKLSNFEKLLSELNSKIDTDYQKKWSDLDDEIELVKKEIKQPYKYYSNKGKKVVFIGMGENEKGIAKFYDENKKELISIGGLSDNNKSSCIGIPVEVGGNVYDGSLIAYDGRKEMFTLTSRKHDPLTAGVLLQSNLSGESLANYLVLSGKIFVRVNNEGGNIKQGDFLMSSSNPGVAMKANEKEVRKFGNFEVIIGRALESFKGNSEGKIKVLID